MRIFVPKETHPGENRVAVVPATAAKFVKLGAEVEVEPGLGASVITATRNTAPPVPRSRGPRARSPPPNRPPAAQAARGRYRAAEARRHPHQPSRSLQRTRARAGARRGGRDRGLHGNDSAQHDRAEDGCAQLAGEPRRLCRGDPRGEPQTASFPMMSTPSGTIRPAKVFIIGVGVAGLQAIATARRLGARSRPSTRGRWSRNR